ncbi:MAG: carboxypeptidase regulatory-like domain-containing protein [Elusimicrobia bacterium]|nr:carboxypeptidase regulatory-like domain-containing protein [Elusimicrobiota bacterium]
MEIKLRKTFVLILLFSILGIFFFKNFPFKFSPFSAPYKEISIDADALDWNKDDLRIVDRDPYIPGRSSHITAISSRRTSRGEAFAIFYPDLKRQNPKIFLSIDFLKGGVKSITDKITTSHPWEILVEIEKGKAILKDRFKREFPLEMGINYRSGFIEFLIPWEYINLFSKPNELFVNAVVEKSGKVVDIVPNKIKKLMEKGVPPIILTTAFSTKVLGATVKFALVHHGNQAVGTYTQPDGDLLYEEGGKCGYNRIIKAHFDTGIPINLHLSGTVMVGIKWGYDYGDTNPNHLIDGKYFLARVKDGVDSKLINILTSSFAQNIMPYAYKDQNQFSIWFENQLINHHFGISQPKVAWVPERTWVNDPNIQWHSGDPYTGANNNVKDKTMTDTFYSEGVRAVVLDGNQHHNWFHDPDPSGSNDNGFPHKILDSDGSFSGLIAFFNNRDLQDRMCSGNGVDTDLAPTLNWIASLGDGAIGVYGDDLEKAAGYSSTWPSWLPDGYVTNLWDLLNHSWIETVNLETFMNWFEFKYDQVGLAYYEGGDEYPSIQIPFGTYENPVMWLDGGDYYQRWDSHASEADRLKTDARSYRDMMNDGMSAIWDAEMITGQDYKTNRLIRVARAVLAAGQYEWMWHDDSDNISDWEEKMAAHTKNACYYAEGAIWAWDPASYGATVQSKDVDKDGTTEYILQNENIMAIFEPDGGRIVAMFSRDSSGQGYVIIGNDVAAWWGCGGDWPEFYCDWVNADHMGALLWHEAEVNDGYFQDTGDPDSPYGRTIPDTVYDVSTGDNYIAFSKDGTQMKKITLSGNNSYFDVEIDVNTSADFTDWPDKKRVIVQFNPNYLYVMKEGKASISDFSETLGSNVIYGVETTETGKNITGWVSIPSDSVVEKSYQLLTRQFIIKHEDGSNPFYMKLGGGVKPGTTEQYGFVTGKVTDETTGSGIASVTVSIDGTSFLETTDSSGNYTISNVPEGTYSMTASKTGYITGTLSGVLVVANSTTTANFVLSPEESAPASGNISGTVKNSQTGEYISGVDVLLVEKNVSVATDSSGSFAFSNISTGTYTLKFSKSGYNSLTQENITVLSEQTTSVNVSLIPQATPTGTISGTVMDTSSNTLSGVIVEISQLGINTYTDSSGNYSLEIATGTYTISFSLSGYKTATKTEVLVTEGASVTVDCQMEKNYWTGDINKDGIVDGEDLMLLGYSYGTAQGESRYNQDADLDSDGDVDADDMNLLEANYGKTGTP